MCKETLNKMSSKPTMFGALFLYLVLVNMVSVKAGDPGDGDVTTGRTDQDKIESLGNNNREDHEIMTRRTYWNTVTSAQDNAESTSTGDRGDAEAVTGRSDQNTMESARAGNKKGLETMTGRSDTDTMQSTRTGDRSNGERVMGRTDVNTMESSRAGDRRDAEVVTARTDQDTIQSTRAGDRGNGERVMGRTDVDNMESNTTGDRGDNEIVTGRTDQDNTESSMAKHRGDAEAVTDNADQNNGTDMCCNETSIPNDTGKRVTSCGKITYNRDTQMCCNGTVYEGSKDLVCCGKEKINVKYEVCPSNKVMISDNLKLCGSNYYHSGFRMCCGSKTYPKDGHVQCCGGHTHDLRISACLEGKIVDLFEEECCGGSVMNSRHQLCCDTESGEYFPVDKSDPNDDKCCLRDGKTYTSATHQCGPYGVEQRYLLIYPCGRQAYDPMRDICCDGLVYREGKTRRLTCQDIISPSPPAPADVMYHLDCPDQCLIFTVTEVHQVYRCPFHAFIAKRIRKSKHRSGGHRRYLVTMDLMAPEDARLGHGQRILKFSQNCRPCIPRSKSLIVIVNELNASMNTFSIVKNTKTNRKYFKKICN